MALMTRVVQACVLIAAFLYYIHVHYVVHEDWGSGFRALLTPKERRIALFSEGAFYFSFGQQFVDADTPLDGFRGLLADNRTEYPDTIIPLQRFNIFPELVNGAAFRSLRWITGSEAGVGALLDPILGPNNSDFLVFHVNVMIVLGGLQWAILVGAAWALSTPDGAGRGATLAAGVAAGVAGALCLAHFPVQQPLPYTRTYLHPELRENWATHALWLQVALVARCLRCGPAAARPGSSARRRWLAALTAATMAFALPWQFAPFVILLETCALAGGYVLGQVRAPALALVVRALLAAVLGTSALMLGNEMLLASFALALLVAIELVLAADRPRGGGDGAARPPAGFARRVARMLAAAVGGALLKVYFARVLGARDDAHVFNMLKAKFRAPGSPLRPPGEHMQTMLHVKIV